MERNILLLPRVTRRNTSTFSQVHKRFAAVARFRKKIRFVFFPRPSRDHQRRSVRRKFHFFRIACARVRTGRLRMRLTSPRNCFCYASLPGPSRRRVGSSRFRVLVVTQWRSCFSSTSTGRGEQKRGRGASRLRPSYTCCICLNFFIIINYIFLRSLHPEKKYLSI